VNGKDAHTNNNSVFSNEELAQFDEEALQGFRTQSKLISEYSATVSNANNPKGVMLSDGTLVSSQIFRTGIGRREKS
jgi:hypothetical protein